MNNIRNCSLDDSENIEYVLLKSWLAKSKEDARETLMEEIERWDDYFLAEDENKNPLWLVSWRTEWRPRHGIYELYHIWILEEARWNWLAAELFDTLVNHAKNLYKEKWTYLRKFYLKSWEQNIWAHKFYGKMWMKQSDSLTSHFAEWRRELIFHLFFDKDWNLLDI